MTKHRTYSRNCFSHKKGKWDGMHEGVGLLHRGDFVPWCFNVNLDDMVFENRVGQSGVVTGSAGVLSGQRASRHVLIASDTDIFVNTDVPAFT